MRRVLIVVFVVAAAFVVAYYFFFWRGSNNVLTSLLPDYFPKEMIKDPYIINLEVVPDAFKLENEKHRAQITYISHKSTDENEKNFKDYFQQNGFKIQEEGSANDQNFIVATKNKLAATVSVWKTSPVKIFIIYIILN